MSTRPRHPVSAGDFFYIPPNTVHAIGAGVFLIEVQQNSDITYRLYDYGRPRELHLEEGLAVARGEMYAQHWQNKALSGETVQLVSGPLFNLDQISGNPSAEFLKRYSGPLLVIAREGMVQIENDTLSPGNCAYFTDLSGVTFLADSLTLLTAPC